MAAKSLKSQLTMLMIVGIVMFIVVGFILYLSKASVKKTIQQNIGKFQESGIETQPIKELIAKCLDKLAKDAIVLIGNQGGYIYQSQGGTLVDYRDTDESLFFVKYNNLNVAYNILPPRFAAPPYSSDIPDYPWQTFPYKTATSNAEIFNGYFGINSMPPLNASEGPNSIQFQIENFIDRSIAGCADFDVFIKQGFDVKIVSSNTSVIIGGDIKIKSKIPITILNQRTKESVELIDFSSDIKLRLSDVYFFIKEIINNDIKNIKFDIRDPSNQQDSIKIKLTENVFSKDDIVIVSDEKSLINGNPFAYTFAVRNRAPALHYIRKTNLEFPPLYEITQNDLLKNSTLKAYDPDEDNLTFKITPTLPRILNVPQINFKVEVSDGKLSDYQIITASRK